MASLSLTIIPSRANIDGTHTIRIAISHKHKTTYISTNFKVDSTNEWKNGRVVGNPDANIINRKLRNTLNKYQDILDNLPVERLSCSQIKTMLSQKSIHIPTIKEFIEKQELEAIDNNQHTAARHLHYLNEKLFAFISDDAPFDILNPVLIGKFEKHLYRMKQNPSSVRIYLTRLKTCVNLAINEGIIKYEIHPFANFNMPTAIIRDIYITKKELRSLLSYNSSYQMQIFSRDMFMLSFFLGGINFADLKQLDFSGDTITYSRVKTTNKKHGEKNVKITIQPEAKQIIDKYTPIRLHKLLNETTISNLTISLSRLGNKLGFAKKLMFYSARKTFVQFGFELDIPLYILEYAIGHTIKEASARPIFNYIVIMQEKADKAIRDIIDFALYDKNNRT